MYLDFMLSLIWERFCLVFWFSEPINIFLQSLSSLHPLLSFHKAYTTRVQSQFYAQLFHVISLYLRVCTNLQTFKQITANVSTNLFTVTVGIRQKDLVSKMIPKVLQSIYSLLYINNLFRCKSYDPCSYKLQFLASDFAVMLFHYDGIVDEWKDFEWSDRVIHVSATNQSKW